jgi:catechol 2,3-dioxygenase
MSSGRYHHHIAANVWHSASAAVRDPDRAGLALLALEAADANTLAEIRQRLARGGIPFRETSTGIETSDPWGTRLRIGLE